MEDSVHSQFGRPPAGYQAGRGRGATGFAGGVSRDDTVDRDTTDYSEANYDATYGYGGSLFSGETYDEDDRVADAVYEDIDRRMDSRRRSRREAQLKTEIQRMRAETPTIPQQFADLKRELATVSEADWDAMPEAPETVKHKHKKRALSVPADLAVPKRSLEAATSATLQSGLRTPIGLGIHTPLGNATPTKSGLASHLPGGQTLAGTISSVRDLGDAKGTVLSVRLDKVSDNISGQTVVDPKGYLTELNNTISKTSDVEDIKKARLLLRSVIRTNPHHPAGWIAAAKMEESAGKLKSARELVCEGCDLNPLSEDLWLEAARLETADRAKAVLAMAVKKVPHSVKLWLDAAEREVDPDRKRTVYRKALTFIPNSVRLWNKATSIESDDAARVLLTKAVECVPSSIELWLQLASLSEYKDAQKVLNEARKKIPTSPKVWTAASELEETNGNLDSCSIIMKRAVSNLTAKGAGIEREAWLSYAKESDKKGMLVTCRAIVQATILVGVEGGNMKRIWMEDAEEAAKEGHIETAKAILTVAVESLENEPAVWLALIKLNKSSSLEAVDTLLDRAVQACPASESLWLLSAKNKWALGDVPGAQKTLSEAYGKLEGTASLEAVSLTAIYIERESRNYQRARTLLARTRTAVDTPKVWLQSVQVERELRNFEEAEKLVNQGLGKHPTSAKLWMVAGQLKLERNDAACEEEAAAIYKQGLKMKPSSVNLWLCAIHVEVERERWPVALAMVERAKLRNPHTPLLWLQHMEIQKAMQTAERGYIHTPAVLTHLCSAGLQDCPNSGLLLAEDIRMEPLSSRSRKAAEALGRCESDPHVLLEVSMVFWELRKPVKCRKWFERTVALGCGLGDAWCAFLAFELDEGDEASATQVIQRATDAKPKQGIRWNRIRKKVNNWWLPTEAIMRQYLQHHFPSVVDRIPQDEATNSL